MSESYIPLVAGFVGALIGALASVITMVVQTKIQDKRQRLSAVIQLALEDYKLQLETLRGMNKPFTIYPIVLHLHYYLELMESMDQGKLTEKRLGEIFKENRRLRRLLEKWNEEYAK